MTFRRSRSLLLQRLGAARLVTGMICGAAVIASGCANQKMAALTPAQRASSPVVASPTPNSVPATTGIAAAGRQSTQVAQAPPPAPAKQSGSQATKAVAQDRTAAEGVRQPERSVANQAPAVTKAAAEPSKAVPTTDRQGQGRAGEAGGQVVNITTISLPAPHWPGGKGPTKEEPKPQSSLPKGTRQPSVQGPGRDSKAAGPANAASKATSAPEDRKRPAQLDPAASASASSMPKDSAGPQGLVEPSDPLAIIKAAPKDEGQSGQDRKQMAVLVQERLNKKDPAGKRPDANPNQPKHADTTRASNTVEQRPKIKKDGGKPEAADAKQQRRVNRTPEKQCPPGEYRKPTTLGNYVCRPKPPVIRPPN